MRSRRWLAIVVAALALALPSAAIASNPAQNQYQLPPVSATGSGGGGHSGRIDPGSPSGSGSSGTTVAILAGGLVAIGAAAGIVVYRRRRGRPGVSG